LKGKKETFLKGKVLIKFVFKNCKSLYLLKANEALTLPWLQCCWTGLSYVEGD
jgi:hypothetical protein